MREVGPYAGSLPGDHRMKLTIGSASAVVLIIGIVALVVWMGYMLVEIAL